MRKAIFVLLDGVGGLPNESGKTELEAAKTPNMDNLMTRGVYGLLNSIGMGIVPGSDTSQLNMLGYDPHKYYPGRGPLEALGAGMKMEEGDVAYRANFATVDDKFTVIDRRAGRIDTKSAHELAKTIEEIEIDGFKFIFRATTQHRGVVIVRGKNTAITGDTDPHKTGKMVLQPEINENNKEMVKAINKYTAEVHRRLREHPINKNRELPANIVLLRGAGEYRRVPTFEERHGLKGCCIAGAALYKGITRFIGMEVPDIEGLTGTFETDLKKKAETAKKCLETHDFVYLHVKATDNAGHDGDFEKKVRFIERIDRELISNLMDSDAVIIITGDHSTPAIKKEHSHEPIPFLIANVPARNYGAKKFCEVECRKGELGIFDGDKVTQIVKAYMERVKKYGS